MAIANGYYAELDASQRRASTIASAIEINRPVNLTKCLRALEVCDGVVREVTDQEILDAKAQVGAGGLGCEPASAASVAGAKQLVAEGVIGRDERVVCILTGHQLKDPTATVAYHTTDQEQFNKVLGSRGVKRRAVRQPRRGRAQRPGRNHQGDPAYTVKRGACGCSARDCRCQRRINCSTLNSHRHSRSRRPDGAAAGRAGVRPMRNLKIVAALESPSHPQLGRRCRHGRRRRDASACRSSATLPEPVDVVIDFSVPAGHWRDLAHLPGTKNSAGRGHDRPGTGTTRERFATRPQKIPLLWSPSMSLAVNLAMKLAEIAGRALKDHPGGADVEIIERHHRFKEDCPQRHGA